MTDVLIIILLAIIAGVQIWNGRFSIDPKRVALTIYTDILIAFDGKDNMTPELVRQQANQRFTELALAVGYPMKARNTVIRRVIELTREEVTPVQWVEDNIT